MFTRFFKGIFTMIIGSAALLSCEPKPLDIELPPHESKLVISSQAVTGRGVVISVSKSFSTLNAPSDNLAKDSLFMAGIVVDHAYVSLQYMGTTTILQRIGPGLYGTEDFPQFYNQAYTLFARDSVSGLECSASTVLLPQVGFQSVEPSVKVTSTDTTVHLTYSLLDPAETRNYYLVNVVTARRKPNSGSNKKYGMKKFEQEFFLLKDDSFNGNLYEAMQKLLVKPYDTILVSLTNISPEYHHYLSLYQKSGSYFNQFTGEPINFPCNVNNGYGFFNLTSPAAVPFLLREHWR